MPKVSRRIVLHKDVLFAGFFFGVFLSMCYVLYNQFFFRALAEPNILGIIGLVSLLVFLYFWSESFKHGEAVEVESNE